MRIRQFFIGMLFLVSAIDLAFAQTKTWTFDDDLCGYKGYYDSKKYTEKQLADTYGLFRTNHYVSDIGTAKEVHGRFDSVIHHIESLQIVQTPYFQRLKKNIVRYLEETAVLKEVEKNAKQDTESLISAVKEGTKAREYAEALHKGGDDLLDAYKRLVKEQMENNSTPEYLWYNYETTMKRADHLERAFDYVLLYGWWNNANSQVHHVNYDGTQMEQFQKLFVKIEALGCDEP